MAEVPSKVSLSFRDFSGRTARVQFFTLADPGSAVTNIQFQTAGYAAGFQAVSNAQVNGPVLPPTKVIYGTNAPYGLARIKAELIFQTDAGAWHRIQVPAIKTSQLYADLQTVNPSASQIAALITLIKNQGCDAAGNQFTLFVAGFVVVKKMPRRSNSIILSPKADTPEE